MSYASPIPLPPAPALPSLSPREELVFRWYIQLQKDHKVLAVALVLRHLCTLICYLWR